MAVCRVVAAIARSNVVITPACQHTGGTGGGATRRGACRDGGHHRGQAAGVGGARRPVRHPWYDECARLRRVKEPAARAHGLSSPQAKVAASTYWQQLRIMRRRHELEEMQARADLWYRDPRRFWRELSQDDSAPPTHSVEACTTHFRALLGAQNASPEAAAESMQR